LRREVLFTCVSNRHGEHFVVGFAIDLGYHAHIANPETCAIFCLFAGSYKKRYKPMQSTNRPNVKLIIAAICLIAGIVILWRSFVRAPDSVASVVLPTPTELALNVTPTQVQPIIVVVTPTLSAPTATLPPTAVSNVIPPTVVLPTAVPNVPNVPNATLPPPTTRPAVIATRAIAPTIALPTPILPTRVTPPTPLPAQAAPTQIIAPTAIPATNIPAATFTPIVATATPLPTATPIATNTPTSTSDVINVTVTPTSTTTASSIVTVVYRIEGSASKVTISYLDETGNEVTVPDATLPWKLQFSAPIDADLAVDAFGTNNEAVALSCAIDINGTNLLMDQTQNAINGVACERFIN
jgi:hypothetical protein